VRQSQGSAKRSPTQAPVSSTPRIPARPGQPGAAPGAAQGTSSFTPIPSAAAGQNPQGTSNFPPVRAGQSPQGTSNFPPVRPGQAPQGTSGFPPVGAGAKPPGAAQTPAAGAPYRPPTPYVYQPKPSILGTGLQRDILSLLIKIAVIVGIIVGLFTFIFGIFQYNGPAMAPAVRSGDLVLFNRFDKTYHAQDLIVVRYQGEMQVRRVVATGGNTVDLIDGGLIVDGARQQEANIFTVTNRYETEIDFPLTVPEGHVFVLGDHREGATDSRTYGPVRVDDTQGKVISIYRRRGF